MAGIFLKYRTGKIGVAGTQLMGRIARKKKSSSILGASKWINQVLIIKKTSNENVLTEEK